MAALLLLGCEKRMLIPPVDASPAGDAGTQGPVADSGPPPDGGVRLDDVLIYAHSADTLYEFSPYENRVTELGRFDTEDDDPFMLDLAVDGDGTIITVGYTDIYVVDPESLETRVAMTYRDDRDRDVEPIFALSFIASDQSPTGREILIGATNGGDLYEIDLLTRRLIPRGRYPEDWGSSGDITSVQGLGTFATVRRRDDRGQPIEGEPDALAEITLPATGNATVRVIGTTRTSGGETFTALFGLGYWGRRLYGFTRDGELLEINRENATSTIISNTTGADQFYGAGVTTRVPVLF